MMIMQISSFWSTRYCYWNKEEDCCSRFNKPNQPQGSIATSQQLNVALFICVWKSIAFVYFSQTGATSSTSLQQFFCDNMALSRDCTSSPTALAWLLPLMVLRSPEDTPVGILDGCSSQLTRPPSLFHWPCAGNTGAWWSWHGCVFFLHQRQE